jgi:hypothetical protein
VPTARSAQLGFKKQPASCADGIAVGIGFFKFFPRSNF